MIRRVAMKQRIGFGLKAIGASPSASGYILVTLAILLNLLVQGGDFFSRWNFSTLANSAAPLVLVSIAQMIIILSGGVDLSLGVLMTVVNALAVTLPERLGISILAAWTLAVGASTLVGAMNGLLVAKLRLPAFLTTFATASILQGLALIILPSPGGRVPREIYLVYNGFLLGIPTPFFIIAGAILLWVLIANTKIGVAIRAVGSHPRNAFITTINPGKVTFIAFTLGGFFTGLAGIALTLLMASGDPWIGVPFTLRSISVVILGGCLFNTGRGGVGGITSGAFFFIIVSNIVFFAFSLANRMIPGLRISTFYQDLATNLIIVFGLVSSVFFEKLKQREVIVPEHMRGADHV